MSELRIVLRRVGRITVFADVAAALALEASEGLGRREIATQAIWQTVGLRCFYLPTGSLPTTGWVHLNLDSTKRWGFQSSTRDTSKVGFQNLGMRTVRDGGVLPNGTPWVLYETESRNAAREGAASNLYVGAENEWRASVATTPFRGLSRVWDFAGRGPSSELALFEHPLHDESSPKRRAGVRLWRNGRVESEHELGGALPGTRDFAVLADADGHFVAGGVAALFQVATDADVPFTLWFVAADRREVRTLSFEDVRLPPVADPMRTVRWGIHFESQESFVVWRRGHTRWRFRYDAGSAAWSHLPEPMATPEEKILDDFADDSKRRVLFVKTTTAGSTWVVVAVDGVGEQLLTTAHLAPECFER